MIGKFQASWYDSKAKYIPSYKLKVNLLPHVRKKANRWCKYNKIINMNCYTFTAALTVRDRSLVLVTRLFKATSLGVTVCVLTVYLSLKLQSILESTHLAPVLTARSICSEEWATSMNWKPIRQPDIDIYRWSSGAQEGGGVMGVTLHPGPFSIHQERCMDRLNVRTRSESWREKVTETDKESLITYSYTRRTWNKLEI